jgi:hypothetical protein
MLKQITLAFATVAFSVAAFAQPSPPPDSQYKVGYAANLNIGDSVINFSNDGARAGFYPNTNGAGNVCMNVYTFDPAEEEVSCCACLVTPNALVSLSAKSDLINNVLTPAIPTSIVVKLLTTVPGTTGSTAAPQYTVCNPTIMLTGLNNGLPNSLQTGGLAWGVTLEPSQTAGTYGPVSVPFITPSGNINEVEALESVCGLIQTEGTGYGVCGSCALGALSGTKQ